MTRQIRCNAVVRGAGIVLALFISGCSLFSQNKAVEEDSALVVPPSLKMPDKIANDTKAVPAKKTPVTHQKQIKSSVSAYKRTKSAKASLSSAKDYFIVVGTYPSQEQALDTFTRLSSIGLPNSTMESRVTKSGKKLHMVRLGPFHDQTKIDKVKESLLSDGLSQFKVVEN